MILILSAVGRFGGQKINYILNTRRSYGTLGDVGAGVFFYPRIVPMAQVADEYI